MSWNLYLDDLRNPPGDGWTLARDMADAQKLFETLGVPHRASLDHDLGIHYCRSCAFSDGEEPCLDDRTASFTCGCTCHVPLPSGLDFLKWIHATQYWPLLRPTVHSANPVGSRRMEQFINDFGPYPKTP